jgi:predicted transcriptional regulator
MEDLLANTGLSAPQASVYLYLLKTGASAPPAVAKALSLTRTNAYKVLDSLVEMGLIRKSEINKKFVYQAEDPIALTGLVARERNRVITLEQSVREAMHELRSTYEKSSSDRDVRTFRGNQAIKSLYINQAKLGQPVHFIKSRADTHAMGDETMESIRQLTARPGTGQYGITPDAPDVAASAAMDRSAGLTWTRVGADDYTAPVEWSVSGDELLIIDFDKEASAIRIRNATVAKAFEEIWRLIDNNVRANPEYKKLPEQAEREV